MSKTCILLGSGNSINEGVELGLWEKIKEQNIWALNSIFKVMPYTPSHMVWIDRKFYRVEANNLRDLYNKGTKLYTREHAIYNVRKEITQYHTIREPNIFEGELMKNCTSVFIGMSALVGVFGLSLVCKFEYEKIFLLGFDWGTPNMSITKTHCYQDSFKIIRGQEESRDTKTEIICGGAGHPEIYLNSEGKEAMNQLKIFLKEPAKIYNVSLVSNIPFFQKLSWEEFFKVL